MARHGKGVPDTGPRIPVSLAQWKRVVRFVETFDATGGARFTFDGRSAQLVVASGLGGSNAGRWRPRVVAIGSGEEAEQRVAIGPGTLWVNGAGYDLSAEGEDALDVSGGSGTVYVRFRFPPITDDTTTTTTTTTTPEEFVNPAILYVVGGHPAPDEEEVTWPIADVEVTDGVPTLLLWRQLSDIHLIGEQIPVVTGAEIDDTGAEPVLRLFRRRIFAIPSEAPPPDDVVLDGQECADATTTAA